MEAAEAPPAGVSVQSCNGLGWLRLDRAGELEEVPTVRCIGLRASKQLASGSQAPAARSAGGIGEEQQRGQTWALLCAGQLSMIPHGFATNGAQLPRTPQLEPSWAPCQVQCRGVSACFEKVAASAAEEPRQAQQEEGAPALAGSVALGEAEVLARALLRGAEAVTGRAGAILSGGAASELLAPRRLAESTAQTAKEIILQAGKIAQRSVEQLGAVAQLPWRLATGGAGEGSVGEEPGGKEPRPRGR